MTATRHVAVLMAGAGLGGAERSLLSLIKSSTASLRFTLVLPDRGELEQVAAAAGAAVQIVPWAPALLTLGERGGAPGPAALLRGMPALRAAVTGLRALLASLQPDVLVTNGIKPHVIGARALRPSPALPLVWYLRESVEGRWMSRAILGRVSGRCDAAVAISKYVAENAAAFLPPAVHPDVIYNIVGVPVESERGEDPLEKPAGEIWFATIGALTPLKGHDVFLRAAAIVSRQRPEARFLVVGSNHYAPEQRANYEDELRHLAGVLNLGSVVRFLGHRRDVPRLLRQIDVLVQCNTAPEGFGRSVVEAMSAGVPVIASRAWSFLELIRDNHTGWLVPPGDAHALADRMVTAALDPQKRREIGTEARTVTAALATPSACAAAFEATLTRAAARRSARQRMLE